MQPDRIQTAKPRPHQTCLIVEDSDFDREKLTRIMQKSNHPFHIEAATTLKLARRVMEKAPVSLILLDNNLPDGLGADFALELARDANYADIPVIIISDWPSPFMWEKASSAGVAFVLSKTEFDRRYVHAVFQKDPSNLVN
ncbi:response regulator [Sulfitobacter sp. M57]|uniref:response regulator n=1 Tax=unclassified Sulfitobacter TaxID=196795 RepID=UPI0023E31E1E|nr:MULTISPECIES: response regulator [unclassified Sulfitobacter]MDF3415315.1 response regulator [Sulfitobacter sp. KE5]MDF3422796.1 response regulator [Sulfitobacter sp. KE43]MDF3433861.1 response regulator [Sulfitobacter sp. KE42]MDF3459501.1 response regulator [Sulfitobacter sp. S74]MDF3463400.1 response regulator [Sulfitobacter sp. Ks18]